MASQQERREQWTRICAEVARQMTEWVRPFITPISKVISHDYGELVGSGSYIALNDSIWLMTNEHVGRHMQVQSLAHQFNGNDTVVRCTNPMVGREYPYDVAITKIDSQVWGICQHQALPIPATYFASSYLPSKGELLFLAGHSSDRASFYFGSLVARATPYITQEGKMPENLGDAAFHFALPYQPDLAIPAADQAAGLPRPPGLSGSVVWNTRYAEVTQLERGWTPEDARVTGIVWGWPSSDACLLATKVEHFSLRELLKLSPS
jgi:hypothetical protein